MAKPNLDDYIDVAERIQDLYAKYPDARLYTRTWKVTEIGDKTFVSVEAAAYRTPEDPLPGVGLAWEPVPGATNFTRNSELMNAETSAWGRAIAALGFETKHIASANDVRNKQVEEPKGNGKVPEPVANLHALMKAMGGAKLPRSTVAEALNGKPVDNLNEWWQGNAEVKLAEWIEDGGTIPSLIAMAKETADA